MYAFADLAILVACLLTHSGTALRELPVWPWPYTALFTSAVMCCVTRCCWIYSRLTEGACVSSHMTNRHVDCSKWISNDSRQWTAAGCMTYKKACLNTRRTEWVIFTLSRTVWSSHVSSNCSIHLLPEVDVSDSARPHYMLMRGWTIAPQNNLPPPAHGLMYGLLFRDTVAVNDVTYGCKEWWTTERFLALLARVTAQSHRILY
jgi:hypothetical protein